MRMPTLWKLVVLIAVLLMPLGMSPVPASTQNHSMTADMPMGHCADQGSGHDRKHGIAECTMACAAALPAADAPIDEPLSIISGHILPASSEPLHGLHPDIATPPPRLA